MLGEAGPTCRAASAGRPEQRSARSPQAASEAAATRRAATQQQQEQPAGADQLTEAAAGLSLELPAGSEAKARAKAPPGAAELADALPLGSRDRGHTACPPHGAKVRLAQALICARWQPREGSGTVFGGHCARAGACSRPAVRSGWTSPGLELHAGGSRRATGWHLSLRQSPRAPGRGFGPEHACRALPWGALLWAWCAWWADAGYARLH